VVFLCVVSTKKVVFFRGCRYPQVANTIPISTKAISYLQICIRRRQIPTSILFYLPLYMISFKATLQKFGMQGEKTGWIYIAVPADISQQIKPNYKKSYRVKGKIDNVVITAGALLPMGEGNFIFAVNATLRKQLKKIQGAEVKVQFEEDDDVVKLSSELLECINDDPEAAKYFNALPPSHKNYYSNWVKSAKSEQVIAKRIATVIKACAMKMSYGEMMRAYKEEKLTSL
jgi:Domain of unknown function (DUF1905)/Bacteriocin-protection, YdeI or OmpD-Associated